MIYFLEINKDQAHTELNLSMIKILAGNKRPVTVHCSIRHFKSIHDNLPKEAAITFVPVRVIDRSFKSWIFKEIFAIYYLSSILRKAKRNRVRLVYIASIFPVSHYYLKLIKKLYPGVKLIIGLHGEVEFIRPGKELKLRLLGLFLKKAFNIKSDPQTKYLVFGEIIKLNLLKFKYMGESELFSIDHPYAYDVIEHAKSKPGPAWKFGCIGIGSVNKNTHLLFYLAEQFKTEISKHLAEFNLTGMMLPNMKPHVNNYVKVSGIGEMISRHAFDVQIRDLHYSLFFYDNQFYTLCASGVFFDAIKFEKPIIALKNDFFEFYFNKLGNIGYLFSNVEEMIEKIKRILNGECANEYIVQRGNLIRAKEILSIDNISSSFWNQVNQYNLY